jgi:hypothetical protein
VTTANGQQHQGADSQGQSWFLMLRKKMNCLHLDAVPPDRLVTLSVTRTE